MRSFSRAAAAASEDQKEKKILDRALYAKKSRVFICTTTISNERFVQ